MLDDALELAAEDGEPATLAHGDEPADPADGAALRQDGDVEERS